MAKRVGISRYQVWRGSSGSGTNKDIPAGAVVTFSPSGTSYSVQDTKGFYQVYDMQGNPLPTSAQPSQPAPVISQERSQRKLSGIEALRQKVPSEFKGSLQQYEQQQQKGKIQINQTATVTSASKISKGTLYERFISTGIGQSLSRKLIALGNKGEETQAKLLPSRPFQQEFIKQEKENTGKLTPQEVRPTVSNIKSTVSYTPYVPSNLMQTQADVTLKGITTEIKANTESQYQSDTIYKKYQDIVNQRTSAGYTYSDTELATLNKKMNEEIAAKNTAVWDTATQEYTSYQTKKINQYQSFIKQQQNIEQWKQLAWGVPVTAGISAIPYVGVVYGTTVAGSFAAAETGKFAKTGFDYKKYSKGVFNVGSEKKPFVEWASTYGIPLVSFGTLKGVKGYQSLKGKYTYSLEGLGTERIAITKGSIFKAFEKSSGDIYIFKERFLRTPKLLYKGRIRATTKSILDLGKIKQYELTDTGLKKIPSGVGKGNVAILLSKVNAKGEPIGKPKEYNFATEIPKIEYNKPKKITFAKGTVFEIRQGMIKKALMKEPTVKELSKVIKYEYYKDFKYIKRNEKGFFRLGGYDPRINKILVNPRFILKKGEIEGTLLHERIHQLEHDYLFNKLKTSTERYYYHQGLYHAIVKEVGHKNYIRVEKELKKIGYSDEPTIINSEILARFGAYKDNLPRIIHPKTSLEKGLNKLLAEDIKRARELMPDKYISVEGTVKKPVAYFKSLSQGMGRKISTLTTTRVIGEELPSTKFSETVRKSRRTLDKLEKLRFKESPDAAYLERFVSRAIERSKTIPPKAIEIVGTIKPLKELKRKGKAPRSTELKDLRFNTKKSLESGKSEKLLQEVKLKFRKQGLISEPVVITTTEALLKQLEKEKQKIHVGKLMLRQGLITGAIHKQDLRTGLLTQQQLKTNQLLVERTLSAQALKQEQLQKTIQNTIERTITTTPQISTTFNFNTPVLPPLKIPPIIPPMTIGGGGLYREKKNKLKGKYGQAYVSDFTSRMLNLQAKNEKQVRALMNKQFTGLEIRPVLRG